MTGWTTPSRASPRGGRRQRVKAPDPVADRRVVRTALFAIFATLALAGCGGTGGRGGYAQGLVSALSSVSQPASLDASSTSRLAGDYARAAERLGRLTPPPAIAEAHARMVAAMRAYAVELARASELTASPAAFEAEMAQAQTDARAWTAAFEEIRARGYATVGA